MNIHKTLLLSLITISSLTVNAYGDLSMLRQKAASKNLKDHEINALNQIIEGINLLDDRWDKGWAERATSVYNKTFNPGAQNLLNSVNTSISSLSEKFSTPRRSVRFREINEILDGLAQINSQLYQSLAGQTNDQAKINEILGRITDDMQKIKNKTDGYLKAKGD